MKDELTELIDDIVDIRVELRELRREQRTDVLKRLNNLNNRRS